MHRFCKQPFLLFKVHQQHSVATTGICKSRLPPWQIDILRSVGKRNQWVTWIVMFRLRSPDVFRWTLLW
jgi:hypothetical protein